MMHVSGGDGCQNRGRPWPREWEGPTKWEGFSFDSRHPPTQETNNNKTTIL